MSKALIAVLLVFASNSWRPESTPPQNIRITGTDYAFQVPEHIRAGEALFSFENRGSVRHEMSLVLLKRGVITDTVLSQIANGGRRRDFVDGQGALIISAPGESPGPQVWLNLE